MTENIQIQSISPDNFEYQDYSLNDLSLINQEDISINFNPSTDYIEYYVYDINGNQLIGINEGYNSYSLIDNKLSLDPIDRFKKCRL